MSRSLVALLLCPLVAASALAQPAGEPLDFALKQSQAEQAAAEAETARLDQAAARARTDAERLHAQQAAAAQAIEAAEARISTATARLQLASASVAAYQQQLVIEQQPVSSLLAGLATMARRPPLMVLASQGGTDELVKVRLLLDSTLPVIRSRTSRLSAQLAHGERLMQAALAGRAELARSRDDLVTRRQRYATLEQRSLAQAVAAGGEALSASDFAMAAGENVERLRGEQSGSQSINAVAGRLAAEDSAPASPFAADGAEPSHPPFAYRLPAAAPVVEGLAAINASGVRSRGLTLATGRGTALTAPADGVVKFAGPFRQYDGVLIIEHRGGWISLVVNLASSLRTSDHVRLGEEIGRALGPVQVELSQNGRRVSPALIAGSSLSLSKGPKGG